MSRYAVELLFEFDKKFQGQAVQKKRICERKIIVFHADSDEDAYCESLKRGKDEEFSFIDDGYEVFYNCLGITELISLEDEDDDVVWWSFEEKLNPHKRKQDLIPSKEKLRLFKPFSGKKKIKLLS